MDKKNSSTPQDKATATPKKSEEKKVSQNAAVAATVKANASSKRKREDDIFDKAIEEAIAKKEKELDAKLAKKKNETPKKNNDAAKKQAKDKKLDKAVEKAISKKEAKQEAAENDEGTGISLKKLIAIIVVGVIGVSALLTGVILATSYPTTTFAKETVSTTKVGFSTDYLGVVERNVPAETKNGGLNLAAVGGYPLYDSSRNKYTVEDKEAVIAESISLCAVGTWIDVSARAKNTYDAMDAQGNLYLNGQPLTDSSTSPKQLYKHVSSKGMYNGDVADDEMGVVKRISLRSRGSGYNITGLYAPAGEVIKVQMSKQDLATTGGLTVYMGQALYNGQANNIWSAKTINRMPLILNTMTLNANTSTAEIDEDGNYTFYVGTFLGGPIYVKPSRENTSFSVVISGAVNYPHFILGYTTPEELEMTRASSAPYFDLMVWDKGVLHSGPRKYADKFSYEELNDVAVLWDKIALVSTQVKGASCGIVFLYDPFVAAGAAVAFPGRNSVNCPTGWMSGSLSYNAFVTSGSWGNMHEYNHNFQGWGLPNGGEVTNNALNIVEYSLFTKVSASRSLGSTGEGMGGWNRYTSASFSTRQISGGGVSPEYPLSIYSTLIHSFGQDNFIKSTAAGGTDNYFAKWSELVHYDMSYFSKLIAANFKSEAYEMSAEAIAKMKANNYPVFVPVSSIYQTGRTYEYDGGLNFCETVQPYQIKYGEDFTVDLRPYTFANNYYQSGSIILPDGLTYEIKKVSAPRYGTLTPTEVENVYSYTPDPNNMKSDKIYVTLEIKGTDSSTGIVIEPTTVDLILEFEQTHEMNKSVLERTVYKPTEAKAKTSIKEAYESNFAGFEVTYQGNNVNASQHCNAEIWGPHDESTFGSIAVLEGKLLVATDGDYSVGLRGRSNTALYISVDGGKTYELALSQDNEDIADQVKSSKTKKYTKLEAGTWIYFKAILKIEATNSYVAVSWGKWQEPQGTIDDKGNFVDEKGNVVTSTEATLDLAYATGYRKSYEDLTQKFESEYFYTRSYKADYTVNSQTANAKVVSSSECLEDAPATNILTDDGSPVRGASNVDDDNPFEITVDMGYSVTADRVIIKGYVENKTTYIPARFVLSAGDSADNLTVICDAWKDKDAASKDGALSFNLDNVVTFRYYKLEILKTSNNNKNLPQLTYVQFVRNLTGGKLVSPDDDMITYKGNWSMQNTLSNYGHIYQGKNASAEFEFYGTNFVINSYIATYMNEFEVLIDGKQVATVNLSMDTNATGIAYMSPELKFGKHKVTIRSKKLFNIESIAIW